ncbi:MAG: hypothetical protein BGP06_16415 [Rhizobiales bacterium 65-9]|nr:type II toxin-antitoxin system VapC family toxin [Hyphomicrobiales bacterium]OJY38044.1 MAG: hypothetical protein BGP06_16415 [Rhizobiales bacterium 65-9]
MKSVVYLDAMCFCYAFEGDDSVATAPRRLLALLETRPRSIATSELALAEIMAGVEKRRALALKRLYLNLFRRDGPLFVTPVTRRILLESARIRAAHKGKLNLADAIHLVAAIEAGCAYFVTNDQRITSPQGGPVILRPNDDGVAVATEAICAG